MYSEKLKKLAKDLIQRKISNLNHNETLNFLDRSISNVVSEETNKEKIINDELAIQGIVYDTFGKPPSMWFFQKTEECTEFFRWFEVFVQEGEGVFVAWSHATQRSFELGIINEQTANWLDDCRREYMKEYGDEANRNDIATFFWA
jgi:hypothetical protein